MSVKTFIKKFSHKNATPQNIAEIILDVNNYKNFIPHVSSSNIISFKNEEIIAELVVSFLKFHVPYTSKITYNINKNEAIINVCEYNSKTFKKLFNVWKITKEGDSMVIDFKVEFEFSNKMLQFIASASLNIVSEMILETFIARAKSVLD